MTPIGRAETSVRNFFTTRCVIAQKSAVLHLGIGTEKWFRNLCCNTNYVVRFIYKCPCIVIQFQVTANKMQLFLNLFVFTGALHVSGGSSAHHQEHITVHSVGHRTPCLRQQPHENQNRSTCHPQHTQISSNSSTIATDNSTSTCIIHYSIELIAFSSEYTLFNNCNFNLVYRYSLSVNLTLSITV